jgi:single-strand DNA-binding protein
MQNNLSVQIAGNVGKNIRLNTMQDGTVVLNFTVAVQPWKDAPTRWFKVTAYGLLASRAADSIQTGTRVIVSGDDLRPDKWTGRDGETRIDMCLRAQDIGLSTLFDSAESGYAARKAAAAANGNSSDGLTFEEAKNQEFLVGAGAS